MRGNHNFASVSRETCLLAMQKNAKRKRAEGPGDLKARNGPYIDELSRRTPAPKACVTLPLIKLSSPPGNEVTRALITRRLIANYERTWFASAIFTFSRASRWRAYQIREVISRFFKQQF